MKTYVDPFTSQLLHTSIEFFQVNGRSVYFTQQINRLTDRSINMSVTTTVVNFSTFLLMILEDNAK